MTEVEFQLHVVSQLASLDTKMAGLIGNGQPGRISKIETNIEDLQKARWKIVGAILGMSALISFATQYGFHFIFK